MITICLLGLSAINTPKLEEEEAEEEAEDDEEDEEEEGDRGTTRTIYSSNSVARSTGGNVAGARALTNKFITGAGLVLSDF